MKGEKTGTKLKTEKEDEKDVGEAAVRRRQKVLTYVSKILPFAQERKKLVEFEGKNNSLAVSSIEKKNFFQEICFFFLHQ